MLYCTDISPTGPGITGVTIHTKSGPIELSRPDGRTGRLSRPGNVTHDVPLPRRDLRDLIGEELRRLDPDDTYAEALAAVQQDTSAPRRRRTSKTTAEPASVPDPGSEATGQEQ